MNTKPIFTFLIVAGLLAYMTSAYAVYETNDWGQSSGVKECNGEAKKSYNISVPTCFMDTTGTYRKRDCVASGKSWQVMDFTCDDSLCNTNCKSAAAGIPTDVCVDGVVYVCYPFQGNGNTVKMESWQSSTTCQGSPAKSESYALPFCYVGTSDAGMWSASKGDCIGNNYVEFSCDDSACQNCSLTQTNQLTSHPSGMCQADTGMGRKFTCGGTSTTNPNPNTNPNTNPNSNNNGTTTGTTTTPTPATANQTKTPTKTPTKVNSPAPRSDNIGSSDASILAVASVPLFIASTLSWFFNY